VKSLVKTDFKYDFYIAEQYNAIR